MNRTIISRTACVREHMSDADYFDGFCEVEDVALLPGASGGSSSWYGPGRGRFSISPIALQDVSRSGVRLAHRR